MIDNKPSQELHPLLLAYIGDAVYELFIRTYLIEKGVLRPRELQQEAVQFVSAVAQSKAFYLIESQLTEEEMDIFKKGRNAKSGSVPKNTRVSEYRCSTGFEAVIGHLYLSENNKRLNQLVTLIIEQLEEGRIDGV